MIVVSGLLSYAGTCYLAATTSDFVRRMFVGGCCEANLIEHVNADQVLYPCGRLKSDDRDAVRPDEMESTAKPEVISKLDLPQMAVLTSLSDR